MLGNTMMAQSQQAQQMPTLSQSQAQLSSSLWSPGKETPRESITKVPGYWLERLY
jgi:nuclear pore complex protein Nup54